MGHNLLVSISTQGLKYYHENHHPISHSHLNMEAI